MRSIWLKVLLVLFSVLLPAGAAEIVLRVMKKPAYRTSGWRGSTVAAERNQLGLRGQPIEYSKDDFVIVLLGDSQVEALACAWEWMPERRLQHHLGARVGREVKVFSLAAGGYGQDQQLLVLREYYEKYRADLVILWETPQNDVWNNLFPTHFPANGWPKPTFRLVNGELDGPTEQMGAVVRPQRSRLAALWRRVFSADPDEEWERYLPPAYVPAEQCGGTPSMDWQQRWDADPSMRYENLMTEKSHFALYLIPPSQRARYGMDLMRRLLAEIRNVAAVHGSKFIVCTEETPEDEAEVRAGEVVHLLNGKCYRTSHRQYLANVSYINRGLTHLSIRVTTTPWRVGPENSHLNEHATDQLMGDLAAAVAPIVEESGQRGPLSQQRPAQPAKGMLHD